MKLLVTCLLWLSVFLPAEKGTIEVEVTHVRNQEGHVLVSLFDQGDGFPGESGKAIKRMKLDIKDGTATGQFTDVPYGSYALSVMHDEDDNETMATNFLGIPKEGYGASNDAKGTMGPPKFEDARFQHNGTTTRQVIKMRY